MGLVVEVLVLDVGVLGDGDDDGDGLLVSTVVGGGGGGIRR